MENTDLVTIGELSDAELDLVAAGSRGLSIGVNPVTIVGINVAVSIPTAINVAALTYGTTQNIFLGVGIAQYA